MRALLVVLVLALALLVPSASADHVYSHRYVVYARVVDEHDRPVPGALVDLTFPETVEGSCNPQARNATDYFGNTVTRNVSDANGFVVFCDHVHALSPSAPATATLSAEGKSVSWTADFETRADYETLVVPGAASVDPAPGTVVAARVWRATVAQTLIEGILVFGDTIKGVNVTAGDKTSVTNNYGDVSMLVDDPTIASVRVLNETFPLTREHGWAHVKVHEPPLPPDLTLVAAQTPGACWWHEPGKEPNNPDHRFARGQVAQILVDNAHLNVTLTVGAGALPFTPQDSPVLLPFSPPANNSTTYGCQPGSIPMGRLTWADPPAAGSNATTTTTTTSGTSTTSTPATVGVPMPSLALVVATCVVLALAARNRKGL